MVKLFKNICASCHIRGGIVGNEGFKSLKFSDLEQRGMIDIDIKKLLIIIGHMKGYKNKIKS